MITRLVNLSKAKIWVISPGKTATTYLLNSIQGETEVIHNFGVKNKYTIKRGAYHNIFFILLRLILIFQKKILLFPVRDEDKRVESMFWNNFEFYLYDYSIRHKDEFKKNRYLNYEEFIECVKNKSDIQSYQEWLSFLGFRHLKEMIVKGSKSPINKSLFLGSKLYIFGLENITNISSHEALLKLNPNVLKENSRHEFWSSVLIKNKKEEK